MEKRVDLLKSGSRYLSSRGVSNPQGESEIFLAQVLGCQRLELYLENLPAEKDEIESFWRLLDRRAKGFPLQYILGCTEFMGLEFKILPGVFIPRPETEILVETVIDLLTDKQTDKLTDHLTILDIGTGCGNIAVSLAKYFQRVRIFACDICHSALKLAKENSSLNKVNIFLIKSNLFSAFKKEKRFSLIVSNLPYIKSEEIAHLSREVQNEPRIALDGGGDGLSYYRRIVDEAPDYLLDKGLLSLEVADNQAKAVKKILLNSRRFSVLKVVKDYHAVERVIVAQKIGAESLIEDR